MKKIYFASTLSRKPLIEALDSFLQSMGLGESTSSWTKLVGQVPDSSELAPAFWTLDLDDVARSDMVWVLPAPPGETLRGALFEAGWGFARGKEVWLIGQDRQFGSWQHTPGIRRVTSLRSALICLCIVQGVLPNSLEPVPEALALALD